MIISINFIHTGIHRCPLIDKEGVVVGLVAQFDVAVELNKELHQVLFFKKIFKLILVRQ